MRRDSGYAHSDPVVTIHQYIRSLVKGLLLRGRDIETEENTRRTVGIVRLRQSSKGAYTGSERLGNRAYGTGTGKTRGRKHRRDESRHTQRIYKLASRHIHMIGFQTPLGTKVAHLQGNNLKTDTCDKFVPA